MGISGSGAAFVLAQWQELQRQTLIYKHIVASVPVPHNLLLPGAATTFMKTITIFSQPVLHTKVFFFLPFSSNFYSFLNQIHFHPEISTSTGGGRGGSALQPDVLRWHGPGAREVPEDGRQEVEVLEGRSSGPEVLRAPHSQESPSFKKACGTPQSKDSCGAVFFNHDCSEPIDEDRRNQRAEVSFSKYGTFS